MEKRLKAITGLQDLEGALGDHPRFLAVAFVKQASQKSVSALGLLEKIASEGDNDGVVFVDVGTNPDVHPKYGVTKVPTILTFKEGELHNKMEGLQTEETYRRLLSNAPRKLADGTVAPPLRVVVYTTRTCPHCTTVKNYLRKRRVPYREVDVSRDQREAEALTRRTGQKGVPQTDINGSFVVGADLTKIDRLIGAR